MDGYAALDSITDIYALGNSPVLHRQFFHKRHAFEDLYQLQLKYSAWDITVATL